MRDAFLINGFNIAALLLVLINIWYTVDSGGLKNTRRKIYLWLLIGIALSALASITSWFLEPLLLVENGKNALWYLRKVVDCFYFFVHISMASFIALHIVTYLGVLAWHNRWPYFWFLSPLIFAYIIILVDPWFDILFTYVPNGDVYVYARGSGMHALYIIAAAYAVTGALFLIKFGKALDKATLIKMVCFYFISFFGIAAQGLNENIQIEIFCEALTACGILLIMEDRKKDVDQTSLALNRKALLNDFKRLLVSDHSFNVITICFDNLPHYSRVLSAKDRASLLRKIVVFLSKHSKGNEVYRAAGSRLLIMVEGGESERLHRLVEEIRVFLSQGIKVDEVSISLAATVSIVRIPKEIHSPDALLNLLEVPENPTNRDFLIVEGKDLAFAQRKLAIEKALREAIRQKSFKLVYQPIYDPISKKMRHAEALVRLEDEELGNISPGEFIPIAEKAGLIGEIGRQLFAQAARFIGSIDMDEYGLEYIEVNLSPMQLYAKDLADEILAELKKNNVEPRRVNLEVTEAAALSSSKVCRDNLDRLMAEGITFSLDDFGSGYANFMTLAAIPFNNVKVDIDILNISRSDGPSRRVYEGVVKALCTELDVVQEGVETKEDLDWVLSINPKMRIQGFYFAKPMPGDAFLQYLKSFEKGLA